MELITAVNICLQWGAGARPISDPDNAPQAVIDAISLEQQKILKGAVDVNTDQFDFYRDDDKKIKLPPNVLGVELPDPYTIRNGYIYDRENRTNVLDRDFTDVWVALDLDFAELEESAAQFIAWSAARSYTAQSRGPSNDRFAYCDNQASTAEVEFYQDYPSEISNESPFPTNMKVHQPGCCWQWCRG